LRSDKFFPEDGAVSVETFRRRLVNNTSIPLCMCN